MSDDQLAAVRSRSIGFVFQGFNLLPRTSAEQNIELPLIYTGQRQRSGRSRSLLAAVGLPNRGQHSPNELSGGEQQRVAIARALVNSPSIILADEPTGNLDSRMSGEIMGIFRSLNEAGITILMVTHEEDIAAHARRLIRFKDGVVVSDQPLPQAAGASRGGLDAVKLGGGGGQNGGRRRSIFNPAELWENLRTASRSLWQNRMRAVLTVLGILIGVGAVIAMVSVGQGATAGVQKSIEGLGSNLLTVMPGSVNVRGVRQGFGSVNTLTFDDAAAIKAQVGSIVGVAPEMAARLQVKYRGNNWNTSIVGTTPDYPLVRNWALAEGSFFSSEDYRGRRSVAVLGQDVATALMGDEDPIGKAINIGGSSFRVVGLLAPKGSGGFFSQDDTVLVPLLTHYARFRHQKDVRSVAIEVVDKSQIPTVRDEIRALLRERHKLSDSADDDFSIVSQADILQTVQGVSAMMTLMLGSIAGISLLVGGIGIMNIMLVSVTERTREIGIRKALGARRRDILAQFLTEAVILSGMGGLFGWGLGWVAARLISALGKMSVVISFGTVGLALGFAVAVGLFFGIYPARKASRMDPIQALHFE
jgi:macrolide transport system ATP-binding/permease protein